MNAEEYDIKTKIIEKLFNDPRAIKCMTPEKERQVNEDIYPGEDIFTTEEGELIDLELQMIDFDADELIKYIQLAEALYEKHEKKVSIYIICPKHVNVYVKECPILSEADFTIKLSRIDADFCDTILKIVKDKVENTEIVDINDIKAVMILQKICEPERREYFLKEYFHLINRIFI